MTTNADLNPRIATALGWTVCLNLDCKGCNADAYLARNPFGEIVWHGPAFSTDLAAAFSLVEKLKTLRPTPVVLMSRVGDDDWHVEFDWAMADAPTLPRAIALAFLKTQEPAHVAQ